MKLISRFIAIFLFSIILVGCSSNNDTPSSTPESSVDINAVISEIFDREDAPNFLDDLTKESLQQTMNISSDMYDEMAGKIGNGRFSIEDALIIKPVDGQKDAIIEALNQHKKNRMNTFEQYNVQGDFEKSKNALIYEQGDYVIMLLLDDNIKAKEIINKYIK